ncbi:CDP-glycerol glycerophosphotransferase, TagB/SpsB family [Geodermatophilus sabuli]|uniref:CDP-glycerol glycerophosphotransferase, TagB/SpsB family n=1 Tax=Geodermatophilus sabuli TaxID=1564158 RepID=A0A285EI85_9ACTN|nr:CDP-glycerol glycerophosphotransferase, TagB/SpsB family [Geodermatophilus sabuli]
MRWLSREVHRVLGSRLTPREAACVYGWPDHEENSLFAAVELAERTPLRVTLLAGDPLAAARYLAVADPRGAPVEIVGKNSARGIWRASRASVLLFTHGLYGSPDLTRRKLVVNLWHGFGPKANDNVVFSASIPFNLMTCDTPLWAHAAAISLGVPHARLVQTGNPRQVALRTPPPPAALERLDLTSSFVLWMPTYRSSNGRSGPVWQDAPALSDQAGNGRDAVSTLAELAAAAGVRLVVKPHPLDADRYEASGLRVITTDDVFAAGMTLYQFIGASSAMISDYSSVWVEYLGLDRPLLLFCPDIADYVDGRGLSEPYMTDIAADLIVEQMDDIPPFLEAVRSGADWRPGGRAAVREALQLAPDDEELPCLAEVVMEELRQRRVQRHSSAR